MATKQPKAVKTATPNPAASITLADIVSAGSDGTYAPEHVYSPMVAAGHVEINPAIVDEHGNVAVRATTEGINAVNTPVNAQPVAPSMQPAKPKSIFEIQTGNEPELAERGAFGGGRDSKYPFGDLPVGGYFIIPKTDETPDPTKAYASSVTSATQRYATPVEGQVRVNRKGKEVPAVTLTRVFKIYRTKNGDAMVKREA